MEKTAKATKYQRLVQDCHRAIADANPEMCLQLLLENLDEQEGKEATKEYVLHKAALSSIRREARVGKLTFDEEARKLAEINDSLLEFVSSLKEKDITLLRLTHDRLLVVTRPGREKKWEPMFPAAYFSQVKVINFGKDGPVGFENPAVVIFDDLENEEENLRNEIVWHCRKMPYTHYLLCTENPSDFHGKKATGDDKKLGSRMAIANSLLTVHARLRELLEFRKIFGEPLSANS